MKRGILLLNGSKQLGFKSCQVAIVIGIAERTRRPASRNNISLRAGDRLLG